jgi:lipoprotein signal peptidase
MHGETVKLLQLFIEWETVWNQGLILSDLRKQIPCLYWTMSQYFLKVYFFSLITTKKPLLTPVGLYDITA